MMYAQYTVTLKTLMDNEQTSPLVQKALSTYPLYEPKSKNEYIPNIIPSRSELNKKILNHYKYREIGFETVGRFLDELEISMHEIMPYYNQLFFTADQDYNIIYNVDYVKTIDTGVTGSSSSQATDSRTQNDSSTAQSTSKSDTTVDSTDSHETSTNIHNNAKQVQSETPANVLNIGSQGINDVDYADIAKWDESINTDQATSSGTGKTETGSESSGTQTGSSESTASGNTQTSGEHQQDTSTVETTKGNFGVTSAQDLIQKYRDIILNIEQMIINDKRITELFMLVY